MSSDETHEKVVISDIRERRLTKITQGGYGHTFVEQLDRFDVECAFCCMIIRDAKQISTCGHAFCSTCWSDWCSICEEPLCCPLDKEVVDINQVFSDRGRDRVIRGLKVYCSYKDFGCDQTPELRDLQTHMDVCQYQSVSCELYCGKTMLLTTLQDHLTAECPNRIVACPVCEWEMEEHELDSHEERCSMKLLDCEFCGSPDILRKEMLEHHRDECKKFMTYCSFALIGCTEKIVRQSLTEHHETHSQQHLQLLNISLCNNIMSGQTQSEGMELGLPPDLWQNVPKKESDPSIDWMELPGCVYGINSCSSMSLIDRVVKLEKRVKSHMNEVIVLKKRNRELENNMIAEITELKKSHTDDITELEKSYINELTEVKKHNSKEESKMKNLQQKYERMEASMAYIPKQLVPGEDNMCPCRWQVEVGKDIEGKISPQFHTKTGYSMDFYAWFEEGHVIAGVGLMKGDHDDELTWPWDGKERLTITDARSDVVHNIVHSQGPGKLRVPIDKERSFYYLCYTKFPLNEGKTVLTFTMSDFLNDA